MGLYVKDSDPEGACVHTILVDSVAGQRMDSIISKTFEGIARFPRRVTGGFTYISFDVPDDVEALVNQHLSINHRDGNSHDQQAAVPHIDGNEHPLPHPGAEMAPCSCGWL